MSLLAKPVIERLVLPLTLQAYTVLPVTQQDDPLASQPTLVLIYHPDWLSNSS
jgi:hypothetical protein